MFRMRKTQQVLTLLSAFWLLVGSTFARMPECSAEHACCTTPDRNQADTESRENCCLPETQPAAPAPQCHCLDHSSTPVNSPTRLEKTRKSLSEELSKVLPAASTTDFDAAQHQISSLSRPLGLFYEIAVYRMTLRWRC
jgi:hypothetical protein